MMAYLIILFISPIILLIILVIPQYIWSLFQKPKLNADVNKLYEKNPEVTFSEKLIDEKIDTEVLVKNFRNTKYKENEWDNEVSWENKKFNFNNLDNLEIMVDNYAILQSHIILIFNFIDQYSVCKRLCVSYEPKKKDPKDFHIYYAFYKNFEAGYILGTFEDLVGVRFLRYANFDHTLASENLHRRLELPSNSKNPNIYKLDFTKNECRDIFLSLAKDVNIYSKKAFFYNFLYRNCLSEILKHLVVTKRFNFSFLKILFLEKLLFSQRIVLLTSAEKK
jgi:hypothetical protein